MSKLDARCQSRAWDRLCALSIQLLELSLVLGCIFFIKLARATNRARELSWAHACTLVRVSLKGLSMYGNFRHLEEGMFTVTVGKIS